MLLLAFVSEAAWAQDLGVITSLRGNVSVERDLQTRVSDVAAGFSLQNFDRVTTGADGAAQIALSPASGLAATITVKSNSSLVVELQAKSGLKQAAIGLLTGSIDLAMQSSAVASELYVRTEGALLRISSTKSEVTTTLSGDLLVSVNEGTIQCEDANGDILFAVPQRAVEMIEGGVFRNVPVQPAHIDAFRNSWAAQRYAAFRTNAQQIASRYAERFIALRSQFDVAYRALMAHRQTLDQWFSEDLAGKSSPDGSASRTASIATGLLHIRRLQFAFERVVNRINGIERYYEEVGRWKDTPQFAFARFFAEFQNQKAQIAERMDTVRYVSKLYVQRGGKVQLDSIPPFIGAGPSTGQ